MILQVRAKLVPSDDIACSSIKRSDWSAWTSLGPLTLFKSEVKRKNEEARSLELCNSTGEESDDALCAAGANCDDDSSDSADEKEPEIAAPARVDISPRPSKRPRLAEPNVGVSENSRAQPEQAAQEDGTTELEQETAPQAVGPTRSAPGPTRSALAPTPSTPVPSSPQNPAPRAESGSGCGGLIKHIKQELVFEPQLRKPENQASRQRAGRTGSAIEKENRVSNAGVRTKKKKDSDVVIVISDSEDDDNIQEEAAASRVIGPSGWPAGVKYTDSLETEADNFKLLPLDLQQELLYRKAVETRVIKNKEHPCYSEKDGEPIGRGVFATETIPEGVVLFNYSGKLTFSRSDAAPTVSQFDSFIFKLGEIRDYVIEIDASESGNESRYVNDPRGVPGAKGPNLKFDLPPNQAVGVFGVCVLESLREIGPGEELLVCYGKDYWPDGSDDDDDDDDPAEDADYNP